MPAAGTVEEFLAGFDRGPDYSLRRPPTTDAARKMLDRILDATTRMWSDRPLEEITVLEICVEADISISSFYARFSGKAELMRAVRARYRHEVTARITSRALEFDWQGATLAEMVTAAITEYIDIRIEFASMFRTLNRLEDLHPELRATSRTEDTAAVRMFADLFLHDRIPDPARRAEVAQRLVFMLEVVAAVVHDLVGPQRIFRDDDRARRERLAADLAVLGAAYLAEFEHDLRSTS